MLRLERAGFSLPPGTVICSAAISTAALAPAPGGDEGAPLAIYTKQLERTASSTDDGLAKTSFS